MKIIVLFGVIVCVLQYVILQVHSENDEIELDDDEEVCLLQTDISADIVIEAKKTSTVLADDPKYKEFLSCCWKKKGYQREDGSIKWMNIQDALKKTYSRTVAAQLILKCDLIKGKTDGDTVALVLLCLDEHAPNLRAVHGYYAGDDGD